MASMVLGAVGFAIGGPIGGAVFGMAGSLIDGMLFHRSVKKPSIQDLLVEASTYGMPIPWILGRGKVAANLIQSSILIAEPHSGKGGIGGDKSGGKKGTQYYTYNVTCAVAVCKGEGYVTNIWRIFADSKVIWDLNAGFQGGPGSDNPQPVPYSTFVPYPDGSGGEATIYHFGTSGSKDQNLQFAGATVSMLYGTANQAVDADAERLASEAGSPAAPAYRNICYLLFHGLPLQDYGNRIPNFTVEVNGFVGGAPQRQTGISQGYSLGSYTPFFYFDSRENVVLTTISGSPSAGYVIYNATMTTILATMPSLSDSSLIKAAFGGYAGGVLGGLRASFQQAGPDGIIWIAFSSNEPDALGTKQGLLTFNQQQGLNGAHQILDPTNSWINNASGLGMVISCGTAQMLWVGHVNGPNWAIFSIASGKLEQNTLGEITNGVQRLQKVVGTVATDTVNETATCPVFACPNASGGNGVYAQARDQLVIVAGAPLLTILVLENIAEAPNITWHPPVSYASAFGGQVVNVTYDTAEDLYIFYSATDIWTVSDPLALTVILHQTVSTITGGVASGATGINSIVSATFGLIVGNTVYRVATGNLTAFTPWTFVTTSPVADPHFYFYNPLSVGSVNALDTSQGLVNWNPEGGKIPLAFVVESICGSCGISGDQLDLTGLTDSIWGYVISAETSGRAALEVLQELYLFDMVETNNVLLARYRLSSVAAPTLVASERDLGARSKKSGNEPPIPRLKEVRTQDLDLPQELTLRYKTASGDFYVADFSMAVASQHSKRARAAVGSISKLSLSTNLVLDDQEAAIITNRIIAVRYNQRTRITTSLPIKYIGCDAGDTVTLIWTDSENNTTTTSIYLERVGLGSDNTVQLEGVSASDVPYTVPAVGQSPISTKIPPIANVATEMRLIEIPPLRDQDNTIGFYWGLAPMGILKAWMGALDRSIDGGANWNLLGTTIIPATLGITASHLDTPKQWNNGAQWDMDSSVDVTLLTGLSLSSVTPEQVLSGSNICVIGKEILGFIKAVQQPNKDWRLSGFLRGIQGTDIWTGNHSGVEDFTMVSNNGSIRDEDESSGAVGVAWLYAGVSSFGSIGMAQKESFTITGLRIKPEPVAQAGLVRDDATNDMTIVWVPRNRIGWAWVDGDTEFTPDEPVEDYEIDVIHGGTVVRTITSWGTLPDETHRTASYTAAQQTTDGITPGSAVTLSIYGISNRIGRGVARTITG